MRGGDGVGSSSISDNASHLHILPKKEARRSFVFHNFPFYQKPPLRYRSSTRQYGLQIRIERCGTHNTGVTKGNGKENCVRRRRRLPQSHIYNFQLRWYQDQSLTNVGIICQSINKITYTSVWELCVYIMPSENILFYRIEAKNKAKIFTQMVEYLYKI